MITVQMAFLLVVFVLTIIAILREPRITLGKKVITLDYGLAPVLAALVLAFFGYMNPEVLRESFLGLNGIVPWQVIVIFFTGAYICVSIDATGVLEYASFKIIRLTGGNKRKLYFGLVGISAGLTIFTSNDIVILTLTPLICYMAKHSKMNPLPYLLAVFFSANAWSMLFYVGNPPNIIVAQAFGLSFLGYAKLMLLPTLAAGISTTILPYIIFRKEFVGTVGLEKDIKPENYLRNPYAAGISVALFALFFAMLTFGDRFGLEVWETVTLFFVIYTGFNLVFSAYYKKKDLPSDDYHYEKTEVSLFARNLRFNITEFWMSFQRVPWKMLPLMASLFIIIHLFSVEGLTDYLSVFLNRFDGLFSGSVATSFVTAIGANIMINQPMTILFANAFHNPQYIVEGSARLTNGLALVIGTNLGGNLTLFGALAGLMWKKILSYHGIGIGYKEFLRHSMKVTPFVILITSLVLYLQMRFVF